ncbi:carboxypeptidase-like regulatory domain-containing protein [soil metagenome]
MALEDDMRKYGAADFERYYSGRMTESEMHALEKAALDDPFLSDALDGYAVTNSPLADIETIKKRLSETGGRTTTLPLNKSPLLLLLRIAAAFVLFGGLTWLFYENNKIKQEEIASITDSSIIKEKAVGSPADSNIRTFTSVGTDSLSLNGTTQPKTYQLTTANSQGSSATLYATADTIRSGNIINSLDTGVADSINSSQGTYSFTRAPVSSNDAEQQLAGKVSGLNVGNSNTFRGTVTNNSGQPLAFANLYYNKNNQGITTSKEGRFEFYSPDSAPLVSVNVAGYRTVTMKLRADTTANYIVMTEAKSGPGDGFANNNNNYAVKRKDLNWSSEKYEKKTGTSSLSSQRVTITNAIPVKGWQDFYSYVKDSLKTLEQLGNKANGAEVLVSFNVNDEGAPIDVSAGKSLCNACAEEAVRIIKNGPAWKLNKKRKKANAVVKF